MMFCGSFFFSLIVARRDWVAMLNMSGWLAGCLWVRSLRLSAGRRAMSHSEVVTLVTLVTPRGPKVGGAIRKGKGRIG